MLEVKLRFHDHCPKHPGYHPSEGRGSIRGGCLFCENLFQLHQIELLFRKAMGEFQTLKDHWEQKQIHSTHKEIKVVQPSLFSDVLELAASRRQNCKSGDRGRT